MAASRATALAPVSNDGAEQISYSEPYTVTVEIKGSAPILFHRWSCESVAEKAAAAKGSKAKKTDDIDSYVYRCKDGSLGLPGEYLRASIVAAAKFKQDPRSPRKSAMDLFKAGILVTPEVASLGKKTWDYLDQRRVMVQRSGITRVRPAMLPGWHAAFEVTCLLPEYISAALLNEVVQTSGRLCGVGDFRPSYGRFQVIGFKVVKAG